MKVAQVTKMDAMSCQLAEMSDLLTQRKQRMETQLHEVCSQLQAISTAQQKVRLAAESLGGGTVIDPHRGIIDPSFKDNTITLKWSLTQPSAQIQPPSSSTVRITQFARMHTTAIMHQRYGRQSDDFWNVQHGTNQQAESNLY